MDDPAFTTSELDTNTQEILLHASKHDLVALKPLLRIPGNASVQDPESGYTPLHAAIAACEAVQNVSIDSQSDTTDLSSEPAGDGNTTDISKAKEVVKELFLSGAIWNDLDSNNETPGCLAWRLGHRELYELCVEAGVRAEMLLGLMGGYEELESGDEDEDEDMVVDIPEDESSLDGAVGAGANDPQSKALHSKKDVNSDDYLKSDLKFEDNKLLDGDSNGVMMAWETDIMQRTVHLLLPGVSQSSPQSGKRILNIGFGMGIIDRMFRDTKPQSHHIIEAHPAVIRKLESSQSDFGSEWEDSAPEPGSYRIHKGKWQDVVPKLLEEGQIFDAIYFDTFGEDYKELKLFFTEYVPGLMDENGKFGFFNGLGADRRVCYDVYCKVADLDLCDAGLDVDWTDVPVGNLGDEGKGEWKGVKRRYWTLDNYRLPICTFLG